MATIKQVAEAAGVRPATVSYVINGTGSVSSATRERVLAAAARLNYAPSHVARSLQRKRSRTIGLVLPGQRLDEGIGVMLSGIVDGSALVGYDLLLAPRRQNDEAAAYGELYRSGRVEGLVILDVEQDDSRIVDAGRLGVPFVCAGRPRDDSAYVAIDGEAGAIEALAHLIVLGHERIGLLTPPLEHAIAGQQDAGYRAALDEAGMRFDEQLVVEGGLTEGDGYAAVQDLLSAPDRPTAILAGSAALAFGALHAAHDLGLVVGRDLSLIAFDDPPAAAHVAPPLTALRQPVYEMGQELARLLVSVIENGKEESPGVLLQSQLIVRQSCGPVGDRV